MQLNFLIIKNKMPPFWRYQRGNGRKNRDKRTNNYLQNTTRKNKVRATRTPLKQGVNSSALEG